MARKINIYNSKDNKLTSDYTTSAQTFGDLADELSRSGLYSSDLSATVRETKQVLSRTDVLPSGLGANGIDFNLFLIANKNKAGESCQP